MVIKHQKEITLHQCTWQSKVDYEYTWAITVSGWDGDRPATKSWWPSRHALVEGQTLIEQGKILMKAKRKNERLHENDAPCWENRILTLHWRTFMAFNCGGLVAAAGDLRALRDAIMKSLCKMQTTRIFHKQTWRMWKFWLLITIDQSECRKLISQLPLTSLLVWIQTAFSRKFGNVWFPRLHRPSLKLITESQRETLLLRGVVTSRERSRSLH